MRKFILLMTLLPLVSLSQEVADTTRHWKTGGLASFNFSQVSLTNWVAGGKNSASGVLLFSTYANYERDQIVWENSLDLGYGLMKEGSNEVVKSDDKIDLNSKLGVKANHKIYYSALVNFRSQFTPGYNYPDTENAISRFLAPGYLTAALGLDYKPNKSWSLFVSPLTGKMTFVTDDELSDSGAFGVDPGKKVRSEFGGFVKAELRTEVMKNVSLNTKLDLFTNYLDQPENIDVRWDVMVNMKINDYLSANLVTNLIYDDDVKVPVDRSGDGVMDGTGPRVQFKQMFGAGLSLKF